MYVFHYIFITHLKHIKAIKEEKYRETLASQVTASILRKAVFYEDRERCMAVVLLSFILTHSSLGKKY